MTPDERAAYARTLTGYGLGPMTERTQLGLPNAELSAAPEIVGDTHGLPSQETGLAAAEHIPGIAAELTGVPSFVRGSGNVAQGIEEGDVLRGAGGVGEMALGAIPGASATRAGAQALARVLASPGRAVGGMTAAAAPMLATEARDAIASSGEKARAAVAEDPEFQRMQNRLSELRAELQRVSSTPIRGMNKGSADAARARMAKPLEDEIAQIQARIPEIEAAAEQSYRSNAPFRERYPGMAEALLYGGAAAASALPFASTLRAGLADRFVHQPAIARQTERVERTMRGGRTTPGAIGRALGRKAETTKPSKAAFESERDTLARMLQSREAREPSRVGQMVGGTALVQEARMIPEEIDAIAFPPGHPTREQAAEALTDPGYYLSGMVPSVLTGVGASHIGHTAGRMLSPGEKPMMDRARMAAELQWRRKAPPPQGSTDRAGRIKDAATERLVRILQGSAER